MQTFTATIHWYGGDTEIMEIKANNLKDAQEFAEALYAAKPYITSIDFQS